MNGRRTDPGDASAPPQICPCLEHFLLANVQTLPLKMCKSSP